MTASGRMRCAASCIALSNVLSSRCFTTSPETSVASSQKKTIPSVSP